MLSRRTHRVLLGPRGIPQPTGWLWACRIGTQPAGLCRSGEGLQGSLRGAGYHRAWRDPFSPTEKYLDFDLGRVRAGLNRVLHCCGSHTSSLNTDFSSILEFTHMTMCTSSLKSIDRSIFFNSSVTLKRGEIRQKSRGLGRPSGSPFVVCVWEVKGNVFMLLNRQNRQIIAKVKVSTEENSKNCSLQRIKGLNPYTVSCCIFTVIY